MSYKTTIVMLFIFSTMSNYLVVLRSAVLRLLHASPHFTLVFLLFINKKLVLDAMSFIALKLPYFSMIHSRMGCYGNSTYEKANVLNFIKDNFRRTE